MINIHFIKQRLNPEQVKMLDDVLEKRENTLQCFKELRRRYSGIKSNIKRIEKKMLMIMEQLPEDNHVPRWIEHEVSRIENKYKAIDKAIKNYKYSQQGFNRELESLYLYKLTSPQQFAEGLRNLLGTIYSADSDIREGEHDIEITKRYFKNITFAFAAHARTMAFRGEIALRDARNAASQGAEDRKEVAN